MGCSSTIFGYNSKCCIFCFPLVFVCLSFRQVLLFYISRQFCVFIIASSPLLFHLEICYKKKPFLALKRLFFFGTRHLTPVQTTFLTFRVALSIYLYKVKQKHEKFEKGFWWRRNPWISLIIKLQRHETKHKCQCNKRTFCALFCVPFVHFLCTVFVNHFSPFPSEKSFTQVEIKCLG